jgi:hypothetical protein
VEQQMVDYQLLEQQILAGAAEVANQMEPVVQAALA